MKLSSKTIRDLLSLSPGKPVIYKGNVIQRYDRMELNKGDILKVKIVSTNSHHKQGISIMVIEPKNKKYLMVNNIEIGGITLWEDTLPQNGTCIEILKDGVKIAIWNAWEEIDDNEITKIWSAKKNAAMMVEAAADKKIYYCNDGDNDEDFDDLIFELKIQVAMK